MLEANTLLLFSMRSISDHDTFVPAVGDDDVTLFVLELFGNRLTAEATEAVFDKICRYLRLCFQSYIQDKVTGC